MRSEISSSWLRFVKRQVLGPDIPCSFRLRPLLAKTSESCFAPNSVTAESSLSPEQSDTTAKSDEMTPLDFALAHRTDETPRTASEASIANAEIWLSPFPGRPPLPRPPRVAASVTKLPRRGNRPTTRKMMGEEVGTPYGDNPL